jgi:hypothetical protein
LSQQQQQISFVSKSQIEFDEFCDHFENDGFRVLGKTAKPGENFWVEKKVSDFSLLSYDIKMLKKVGEIELMYLADNGIFRLSCRRKGKRKHKEVEA